MVAVALLGIALVFWRAIPRDHQSHITHPQAVRLFHDRLEQGSQIKAEGRDWPGLGVYRYETSGTESIDTGLFGGSHDYEGLSTVTLWPGDCGLVERWQVLATRWSESETCRGRDGHEEIHSRREFHEFFNVSQEDAFECDGWSPLSVAKREPHRRVTSRCRSAGTTVISRMDVVGIRRVGIGGAPTAAVYMKGTSRVRGESWGAAKFSEWRRRGDGLLLRRRVNGAVDSEANGGFGYRERYTLELISLTPER